MTFTRGPGMGNWQEMDVSWDAKVLAVTFVSSFAWVGLWQWAASTRRVATTTSRRVLHVTSCPLFMLFWPLFENDGSSRYYAAFPPIALGLRLLLAGLGNPADSVGKAVSRTGKPREALQGPLIYCICMLISILVLWRDAPGPVTMIQMCFGDGLASLFGPLLRGPFWPQRKDKRISGTAGFLFCAFLGSLFYVAYFHSTGATAVTVSQSWKQLLAISATCAMVEVIPLPLDDNFSVPLVAGILSKLLL